jgi:hypothetical protein
MIEPKFVIARVVAIARLGISEAAVSAREIHDSDWAPVPILNHVVHGKIY